MKIKYFLTIILAFFFVCLNPLATKIEVTYDGVGLRKGPGTDYTKLQSVSSGAMYDLLDTKKFSDESKTSNKCSAGWYKISYGAGVGYICSTYVSVKEDVKVDNSCMNSLKSSGFPEDYSKMLCELKVKYPNWEFSPLLINIDFSKAVESESACGLSYVYTSDTESIDSSCNNVYNTTGTGWYPASKSIVAYYMDPRNFLSEKYIFQFENLKYTSTMKTYYPSGIITILKGSSFYKYHESKKSDLVNVLNVAAEDADINAIFLASRILQELGNSDKEYNLYSGVYSGFEGYYNFYNFGVTDACANTYGVTKCGLDYAKQNNWNSLYNALYGGASILSSYYNNVGQNTNYLQKYNVAPSDKSKLYIHQYMTNIAAPSSEASSSYNSYKENNMLSMPFKFIIPVYNNMDSKITNTSSGAVDDGNESKLNNAEIGNIITSSGYKYSSNYFTGIKPGTDAKTIINAISSVGGSASIYNKDGSKVTSGLVGTGYKIEIKNSETSVTLKIVIYGDTSGDGKITALDLGQVQKNILNLFDLSGEFFTAADTSRDGRISALDLGQVQKDILNLYEVNQK